MVRHVLAIKLPTKPLRQTVQVLRHAFQLAADLRTLLSLARALIAELRDAGNLLADVFCHVALFFGGGCHLLAHAGDAGDGLADAVERFLHGFDAGDALL